MGSQEPITSGQIKPESRREHETCSRLQHRTVNLQPPRNAVEGYTLLGQPPLLTPAEEQTWNPPPDPDLDPPASPTPVPCSAPRCPRCQQVMRLVGGWRAGQALLYPKRPP